jgi:hypothetical protein
MGLEDLPEPIARPEGWKPPVDQVPRKRADTREDDWWHTMRWVSLFWWLS